MLTYPVFFFFTFYLIMLQKFYMVGSNKSRTLWKVLKIDRLEPSELSIREDPTTYSESECFELLKRVHEGNISTGGLKFVTKCYGIAGTCSVDSFRACIKEFWWAADPSPLKSQTHTQMM